MASCSSVGRTSHGLLFDLPDIGFRLNRNSTDSGILEKRKRFQPELPHDGWYGLKGISTFAFTFAFLRDAVDATELRQVAFDWRIARHYRPSFLNRFST